MEQIYLSRRNLLTLLSKLDRVKEGEASMCTIIKNDSLHPLYPQSMDSVMVTAVEDSVYYNRPAGDIHPSDEERIKHSL